MKKVSLRASFAIIMALLVIVGLVLYVFRFVQDGEKWALYFDESTSKCTYTLRDRDGTVLAKMGGGSRTYAESSKVRTACYQLIGDFNKLFPSHKLWNYVFVLCINAPLVNVHNIYI